VSGRGALRTLLVLTLSVQVVLLPALLLPDLGELGTSIPWFCEIWVGYGLMASGLLLLLELALEDKTLALISIEGTVAIATYAAFQFRLEPVLDVADAVAAQAEGIAWREENAPAQRGHGR
jgi:hypothetical protein